MKTIYFLKGLPASGKTTWAKTKLAAMNRGGEIRAIRTNKDEIRIELAKTGGNSESKVIRRETELIVEALTAGLHVIIDNTHFNPIYEWRYRALAKEYGYKFEVVSFTRVPVGECIRRDSERPDSVGSAVILRMDEYRQSFTPAVVAALKKQWAAKKAADTPRPAAAKKLPAKFASVKNPAQSTPAKDRR